MWTLTQFVQIIESATNIEPQKIETVAHVALNLPTETVELHFGIMFIE